MQIVFVLFRALSVRHTPTTAPKSILKQKATAPGVRAGPRGPRGLAAAPRVRASRPTGDI